MSSDRGRRVLAAIGARKAAELMLISDKATGKSYHADLRPAVCACLVANQRTRTTECVLPVRDAAEADCRNDVEHGPDSLSAAAGSHSIGGEVGGEGRGALLIQEESSVERSYLRNISTAAIERLWPLGSALLRSSGMVAVRRRKSPCQA
ncbi:hypothetical protein BSZ21_07795 [Bradyrhizobium canariense]|nr:hypothetical protein BSZ21_07795 [Bradyrhizobium canariense]